MTPSSIISPNSHSSFISRLKPLKVSPRMHSIKNCQGRIKQQPLLLLSSSFHAIWKHCLVAALPIMLLDAERWLQCTPKAKQMSLNKKALVQEAVLMHNQGLPYSDMLKWNCMVVSEMEIQAAEAWLLRCLS